jgi:hypothetical protein
MPGRRFSWPVRDNRIEGGRERPDAVVVVVVVDVDIIRSGVVRGGPAASPEPG